MSLLGWRSNRTLLARRCYESSVPCPISSAKALSSASRINRRRMRQPTPHRSNRHVRPRLTRRRALSTRGSSAKPDMFPDCAGLSACHIRRPVLSAKPWPWPNLPWGSPYCEAVNPPRILHAQGATTTTNRRVPKIAKIGDRPRFQ